MDRPSSAREIDPGTGGRAGSTSRIRRAPTRLLDHLAAAHGRAHPVAGPSTGSATVDGSIDSRTIV